MSMYFLLICMLLTHRLKAVKCICSSIGNKLQQAYFKGATLSGHRKVETGRASPKVWNEIRIKHVHSENEHKASSWVNKENRQRVRVREHKQNSANLLFAFLVSRLRSSCLSCVQFKYHAIHSHTCNMICRHGPLCCSLFHYTVYCVIH